MLVGDAAASSHTDHSRAGITNQQLPTCAPGPRQGLGHLFGCSADLAVFLRFSPL